MHVRIFKGGFYCSSYNVRRALGGNVMDWNAGPFLAGLTVGMIFVSAAAIMGYI
jgi:hypothetical protein